MFSCEGAKALSNPYFNYLPFQPTKGEVLLINIDKDEPDQLLKHRIFLVPQGKGRFWAGATNDWDYPDEKPSQEGRSFLEDRLKDMLSVDFHIDKHQAAIRPTVKDRRPFLGAHPDYPQLFIFNGLGTKGASLGPYFAKQMADLLQQNKPVDPEVDVKRVASTEL